MDMLRTATILEQIHNAYVGMFKFCVLFWHNVVLHFCFFIGLPSARIFPKILCIGEPNLLIVAPG